MNAMNWNTERTTNIKPQINNDIKAVTTTPLQRRLLNPIELPRYLKNYDYYTVISRNEETQKPLLGDMPMPSFDAAVEVDSSEVVNAVENALREVTTRYDFKGSKASIEWKEKDHCLVLTAEDDMKLTALREILNQKLSKRGVSLKSVTYKEIAKAGGDTLRQEAEVRAGLTPEELKSMNKFIKTLKVKVSSQSQEDQLRVTGKKRDDLQEVMTALREEYKDLDFSFQNFRD
jgi:uncharacterized protein YajQ (UPF0234 family)